MDADARAGRSDLDHRLTLRQGHGPIVMRRLKRYPSLTYVAQDRETLDKLVWGEPAVDAARPDLIPIHSSHPYS